VTASLRRPLLRVSANGAADAHALVRGVSLGADGARFELVVPQRLLRTDGSTLEPLALPLELSLLGRQQVTNASLAALAALLAGATPDAVRAAFARMPALSRRMQVVHPRDPFILDDTVGNPASLRAVFEAAAAIPHERLRVGYAVRGARGATINRYNAEELAECVAGTAPELVVTASEEAADERNHVSDEDWAIVPEVLRGRGVEFRAERTLHDAVTSLVLGAGPGDLVLLLGAQGMDGGADIARDALSGRARVA
jgi:UDP-N-acetylmuramoyl-L-alanyl-D-glutamate--2,6-diaminopimelate ligase